MIFLRLRGPFEPDWTLASFEGEEDEVAAHILCASLLRLEWTILISRDGSDFYELGEDEEPSEESTE